MKKTIERLCCMSALALLLAVLAAQPVLASDVDVAAPSGFGAVVATLTPDSPLVALPAWLATLSEKVYFDGSAYTYVFHIANSSISIVGPNIFATSAAGFKDNFSSGLNWGVVTGLTYTSIGIDDTGFTFGGSSLRVGINEDLPKGDAFTFYAQSPDGPTKGIFTGVDGGIPGFGPSLDPGPEPSSILLFGTGITAFGLILRRRLLTS